jgi:hypothetical protein
MMILIVVMHQRSRMMMIILSQPKNGTPNSKPMQSAVTKERQKQFTVNAMQ